MPCPVQAREERDPARHINPGTLTRRIDIEAPFPRHIHARGILAAVKRTGRCLFPAP